MHLHSLFKNVNKTKVVTVVVRRVPTAKVVIKVPATKATVGRKNRKPKTPVKSNQPILHQMTLPLQAIVA
jgi:hypothetical protein